MACTTTHSAKVPGAGLCCQAVANGSISIPPGTTTLPRYIPGQAAAVPLSRRTLVTTANGHCGTCMIVGSTSTKHPNKPVLKFIPGGPGCPTSGTGCCALGTEQGLQAG